jgi:hypothetical protein
MLRDPSAPQAQETPLMMRGRTDEADRCKDYPWECGACSARLAFVDAETKTQVRIKHKDLFVYVSNPDSISITCRFCGAVNKLTTAPDDATV